MKKYVVTWRVYYDPSTDHRLEVYLVEANSAAEAEERVAPSLRPGEELSLLEAVEVPETISKPILVYDESTF